MDSKLLMFMRQRTYISVWKL